MNESLSIAASVFGIVSFVQGMFKSPAQYFVRSFVILSVGVWFPAKWLATHEGIGLGVFCAGYGAILFVVAILFLVAWCCIRICDFDWSQ